MRILLTCSKCVREAGEAGDKRLGLNDIQWLERITDDGLYETRCPKGHENVFCLQVDKFEVLFDLAINAIVDGYYREAIASFTSSLERFYEFYINVICEKHGIDENTFELNWKLIAAQSERQLGAFIFIYVLENKKSPALPSQAAIELRNKVIHRGLIPTKDQALSYGHEIFDCIRAALEETAIADHALVLKVASDRANRPHQHRKIEIYLVPHTSLGVNRLGGNNKTTFENEVRRVEQERTALEG